MFRKKLLGIRLVLATRQAKQCPYEKKKKLVIIIKIFL